MTEPEIAEAIEMPVEYLGPLPEVLADLVEQNRIEVRRYRSTPTGPLVNHYTLVASEQ